MKSKLQKIIAAVFMLLLFAAAYMCASDRLSAASTNTIRGYY